MPNGNESYLDLIRCLSPSALVLLALLSRTFVSSAVSSVRAFSVSAVASHSMAQNSPRRFSRADSAAVYALAERDSRLGASVKDALAIIDSAVARYGYVLRR